MTSSSTPARGTVVVTGASNGIGLELALCAAREGHALVLNARGAEALERAAEACRAAGSPDVRVVAADASTAAGIDAIEAAVEELGAPVAALVNNAGFGIWGPFVEQDEARVAQMVDLNARSLTLLTHRLLQRVVEARGGILNVASVAAFQPGPGMSVYHATKGYVLWLSLGLRDELRASGVRVTALCPGPVPTGFADAAGLDAFDDMQMARLAAQPAGKVARAGWDGLRRGDAIVVPGLVPRVSAIGARLLPLAITTRLARRALGAIDATGRATSRR
jgi:short-subunit dehydrogenase